jgi:hypothetical protein
MLSVAGFYKHLTDYIVSGQTTETHTVTYRSGGSANIGQRQLRRDFQALDVAAEQVERLVPPELQRRAAGQSGAEALQIRSARSVAGILFRARRVAVGGGLLPHRPRCLRSAGPARVARSRARRLHG